MIIPQPFLCYIDRNGLFAPSPVAIGTLSASNNGVMYTSEVMVIIAKLVKLEESHRRFFNKKIQNCISPSGMLNRVPLGQKSDQEGPDDYYAVLNACKHLGNTEIPRIFLRALITHLGFLNNVDGSWTGSSFLARQPQLIAAMVAAAFPERFSRHIFARLLAFPFFLVAAIVIATSCINTPPEDQDARRLSWHLLQTTKGVSLLCFLASLLWYRRLYKTYPNGMKDVAATYYHPTNDNPYAKYWVD